MAADRSNKKKIVGGTPKNFMIPVLLLLLRDWNAHGYELMQKLIQFGFPTIDQGNFYRTLRQLENDELVSSEWDTSAGGPAKRIYSITSAGEQYLQLWADSMGNYQKMLDNFFNMYSQSFMPPGFSSSKNDKQDK